MAHCFLHICLEAHARLPPDHSLGRMIPIEDVQVFGLQWLPEGNNPIRAASMTVMIAGWLMRRSAVIDQKLS